MKPKYARRPSSSASSACGLEARSSAVVPRWVKATRATVVPTPKGEQKKQPVDGERGWTPSTLPAILERPRFPAWFFDMVLKASKSAWALPLIIGAELFAGLGELSKAFGEVVGTFIPYAILNDESEDVLNSQGLYAFLILVLRIRRNGVLWMGTPCKSWVCLSRPFTQRSMIRPGGPKRSLTTNKQQKYLDEHNALGILTGLLMKLAHSLGIQYVVEQPMSSLLFQFEPVLNALATTQAMGIAFQMSTFQGTSPKPLRLKGTASFLRVFDAVAKARCKAVAKAKDRLTTMVRRKDGTKSFTGKQASLTESSGYTRSFGMALALGYSGRSAEQTLSDLHQRGL